jgi:hypothetical protein
VCGVVRGAAARRRRGQGDRAAGSAKVSVPPDACHLRQDGVRVAEPPHERSGVARGMAALTASIGRWYRPSPKFDDAHHGVSQLDCRYPTSSSVHAGGLTDYEAVVDRACDASRTSCGSASGSWSNSSGG